MFILELSHLGFGTRRNATRSWILSCIFGMCKHIKICLVFFSEFLSEFVLTPTYVSEKLSVRSPNNQPVNLESSTSSKSKKCVWILICYAFEPLNVQICNCFEFYVNVDIPLTVVFFIVGLINGLP